QLRRRVVDLGLELCGLGALVVDGCAAGTGREDQSRERREGEHEGKQPARQSIQHEPRKSTKPYVCMTSGSKGKLSNCACAVHNRSAQTPRLRRSAQRKKPGRTPRGPARESGQTGQPGVGAGSPGPATSGVDQLMAFATSRATPCHAAGSQPS